jgi:hypothetical protein
MARRAGGALLPAVQHRARFHLLRRADAARRAGPEGRADAGPGEKPPSRIIDFDALSDPEASLLLIDATTAPYVHKYQSVKKFLEPPYQETRDVATITGVGSSALGSAALAWDISVALEKPVLAIVPGYGVADVVLQRLGGGFAFGLHDFLSSKTVIQTWLATAAPETARIRWPPWRSGCRVPAFPCGNSRRRLAT